MADPTEPIFNPARRLHSLSGAFLDSIGNPTKITVGDRWCDVLGIPRGDLGALLHAYTEIARLPQRARDKLNSLQSAHPDHVRTALEPLPVYEALFRDAALHQNAQPYTQRITGEVLANLNTAAMLLEMADGHEPPRDEEQEAQARTVREELEAIRQGVADDPDLDPKVRAYLLRHLSHLCDALAIYAVDGLLPVIDALDMMRGHDERDPETAKAAHNTPYWTKIHETVRTFGALVQIAAHLSLPLGGLPAIEAPEPPAIEQAQDSTPAPGGPQP